MAKTEPLVDALVIGEHPSAYLTAALLRVKSKLRVVHSTVPEEHAPDRLVLINPKLFDLHPLLEPLRRKLDMTAIYGLQFLADDPETRGEFRSKSAVGYVASYKDIRAAMTRLAEHEGVELHTPKTLHVRCLDEAGLDVTVGKSDLRPRALVVGSLLSGQPRQLLGIPDAWEAGVLHRYSFVKFRGTRWVDLGGRPIVPMSLDLRAKLMWAWLLPHDQTLQLAVVQPAQSDVAPRDLLAHWLEVLKKHHVVDAAAALPAEAIETVDMPLAGALAHEGVANRTLLVGPAGGFYSASGEDVYPCCWSALHAADALKKALKERHLQDALNVYRHKWRTTLGDYLRGPQQNLRFLLPLIYRNPVMTARLSESILLGKSVVR